MTDYGFDLGPYGRAITTSAPAAQIWFDRGLNWLYGYNHGEAIFCFEQALAHDPDCAMAHWGVAYAAGPNYNLPWHLYDPKGKAKALGAAYDAMEAALAAAGGASPVEAALIRALPARYQARTPLEDMDPWNAAFTAAMRDLFTAHPDDLEVRFVFVEAIMNLTPWKMWDLDSGAAAEGALTDEAMAALDQAFETMPAAWSHPGLLHLHVHLLEMSPFPERALRTGDRLRSIAPDLGHLIHMPTHIDVQCGQYRDVVVYNQRASAADAKFLAARGPMNVYNLYRIHNLHFTVYGAMLQGDYGAAMAAAEAIIDTTPEEALRIPSPPMADFLEAYLSMKQHVLVRFGKWREILDQDLPADPELYAATTAMMLYAKTLAHAALGEVDLADQSKARFLAAKAAVPDSRRVHNNRVKDLLAVAEAMLNGELAYRRQQYDAAFAQLREAIALEGALPYDEPWGWMQPVRHALGALLLEQGRVEEAEAVYRADLGLDGQLNRASIHIDTVWSLHGLYECLTRRGAAAEAAALKPRLDIALARADQPIAASCYCRRGG